MNDQQQGLISAYLLNGAGGATQLSWQQVNAWKAENGVLWLHFDFTHPGARQWLLHQSNLSPIVSHALIADDTRPRCVEHSNGILTTLRAVNLNPGADPENMVSIRIWCQSELVVTTLRRPLLSVDDLREQLVQGCGPKTAPELLIDLAECLARRISDVCDDVDEKVETLGENVLAAQSYQLRTELSELRRQVVLLRRYLAPQREALNRLSLVKTAGLTDLDRLRLREIADRVAIYVEDLDSARDRASVTHEELMGKLAEQVERRMYVLSIIAAIFLPVTFLTGLLGINVAGIPLAEDSLGFVIVSVLLLVVVLFEIWLFRKLRWL